MNKRLIGVILAILLAGAGTFFLVSYVDQAEERVLAEEERVPVLLVTDTIARGSTADEIGSRVRTALVPAKVQAAGSVASLADLEDRVAAVDLLPGEQVLADRFVDPDVLQTETKVEIPAGMLEVALSLSPERALGGRLLPGSTVALVASCEPFTIQGSEPGEEEEGEGDGAVSGAVLKTPNTSHVILHKVLVTNVQVERVPTESADDEAGYDLAPTGNLLITLALSAPDLEKAVFASEHGTVWLAGEPEGTPEDGTRIQTRETIYR